MPSMDTGRNEWYAALRSSNVFKRVEARYTANTLASLWTPASGKKFVLKGFKLKVVCTTTSDGSEAVGSRLALLDGAAATPLLALAAIQVTNTVAGCEWPGPIKIGTATNTYLVTNGNFFSETFAEGYKSATANNVLKFGLIDGAATPAVVTIANGVFNISGVVFGTESK